MVAALKCLVRVIIFPCLEKWNDKLHWEHYVLALPGMILVWALLVMQPYDALYTVDWWGERWKGTILNPVEPIKHGKHYRN